MAANKIVEFQPYLSAKKIKAGRSRATTKVKQPKLVEQPAGVRSLMTLHEFDMMVRIANADLKHCIETDKMIKKGEPNLHPGYKMPFMTLSRSKGRPIVRVRSGFYQMDDMVTSIHGLYTGQLSTSDPWCVDACLFDSGSGF